jgi:hypothetical protein
MKYADACSVLGIQPSESLTVEIIKRQYRLKALRFHPDKNKDPDAQSKFISVNEAYQYMMNREGFTRDDENDGSIYTSETTSYVKILESFIRTLANADTSEPIFHLLLTKICGMCEANVLKLLSKLDKSILIKTYDMLYKYQDAFHLSPILLVEISNFIKNKSMHDECIILNPTLSDLYNNNVYKLTLLGQLYIIPLWHHELVYDNSGCEVYIKCYPILPENMEIDDKNNIHITVCYSIQDLLRMETVHVLCNQLNLPIAVNTLKIVKRQRMVFAKQGITRINVHNIYDISETSDVIITILLE